VRSGCNTCEYPTGPYGPKHSGTAKNDWNVGLPSAFFCRNSVGDLKTSRLAGYLTTIFTGAEVVDAPWLSVATTFREYFPAGSVEI